MTKKSQRQVPHYEKANLGCMWGLISMFDFRRGGYAQKLLSDKRHGSRNAVAGGHPKSKLKQLTYFKEKSQDITCADKKPLAEIDAKKPSVKKLIEEEMVNEETRKQISIFEVEKNRSESERGGHMSRTQKRSKRTDKKTLKIQVHEREASESFGSVDSIGEHSINSIVEEICDLIQQRSVSIVKHDQQNEINVQPISKQSDFKEKVREATAMVINQKFVQGKLFNEDGKVQKPKEFLDAIAMIFSNNELVKELLEDPNSKLMKHIRTLQGHALEQNENTRSFEGPNSVEPDLGSLRETEAHVSRKYYYFFHRKVKSHQTTPSDGPENPGALSKIVILKPGQTGLQNGTCLRVNDRSTSHFSLTEIKRKLKQAMGKEKQGVSQGIIMRRKPYDHQTLRVADKATVGENFGRKSPSREHFYTERIPKQVVDIYRGDNTDQTVKHDKLLNFGTDDLSKQRASNIYLEAKRHLSEMLSNADEDEDSSSKQVPKTLGKILCLPEYNFSPLYSPRKDWDDTFVTAKMKFSVHSDSQADAENMRELKEDCSLTLVGQSSSKAEDGSCSCEDSACTTVETPISCLSTSKASKGDKQDETLYAFPNGTSSEEIQNTAHSIFKAENDAMDVTAEPSNPVDIGGNVTDDICAARSDADYKVQDTHEDNQVLSSPLTSSPTILNNIEAKDTESAFDKPERPSPVSVLEPIFSDDDISPAGTRSVPVELPVEPLCIQFEEYNPSTIDQNTGTKASSDDKEALFKFVKAVLLDSGLCWEKFYMIILSDQDANPSLLAQVDFPSVKLPLDQCLLFDCTNEVLVEVCLQYLGGSPWVQYVKSNVRPLPNKENAICEVWEGIEWHLLPQLPPRSLDQLIRKDLTKTGTWMDLRFDVEDISSEMSDLILDGLIDEAILSCNGELVDPEEVVASTNMQEEESCTNL